MEPLTVLVADPESDSALPQGLDAGLLRATRSIEAACDARRVFVVSSATRLPAVAGCISRAARRHRLYGLFVRNDMGEHWVMQIFERASLRRIRNSVVHRDARVGQRILQAMALGAQTHFIADATVADDRIHVMDCAFNLYEMPFDAYPALRRIPPDRRRDYEIVLDGGYLHWNEFDADLDLESIRLATDPVLRARVERQRVMHDEAFGLAVRAFREEKGLRQADVPGLSERQVRRIEKGETVTPAAVDALALAHRLDPDAYLNEVAERIPDGAPM